MTLAAAMPAWRPGVPAGRGMRLAARQQSLGSVLLLGALRCCGGSSSVGEDGGEDARAVLDFIQVVTWNREVLKLVTFETSSRA